MPDGESPPPAWEWREHGLIIVPGLSWEEWSELWSATDRIGRSSQFYVGDALNAGRREFGERFSQVVDARYLEQNRGAMWVCERIPFPERQPRLSYSAHREAAGLSNPERAELLDLAARSGWGAREIREEITRRQTASPRTNGGPSAYDDEPALRSTEPMVQDEPQERYIERSAMTADIYSIRALIDRVKQFAEGAGSANEVIALEGDLCDALAVDSLGETATVLTDAACALCAIPAGWMARVSMARGMFTVELVKGEQRAIGILPTLETAICEASLGALLSDLRRERD